MDKNKFLLIVILTVVSMVSILLVQFSWISQINELNNERFEKDINDVLFTVNQKLEEREILILTRENLEAKFKISRSNETGGVELIESIFSKRTIQDGEIETKQNSLQFDLESSNKNVDSDDNINASILVEDFNEVTVDTLIQKQIDKVLDRSEMIQIILNKLLTGARNINSVIKAITGFFVFLSNSVLFAGIFNTFLANSITATCIPRHIPKKGISFTLANFAIFIIPFIPLPPNPPGMSIPSGLKFLTSLSKP